MMLYPGLGFVGGAREQASKRVYPAEENRRGREISKQESIPRRRKKAGQGSRQAREYTPLKKIGGVGKSASKRVYPAEGKRRGKGAGKQESIPR